MEADCQRLLVTDVTSADSTQWYVVRQPAGQCTICDRCPEGEAETSETYWGPFASQADAIARRVGLIRAGQCQPV